MAIPTALMPTLCWEVHPVLTTGKTLCRMQNAQGVLEGHLQGRMKMSVSEKSTQGQKTVKGGTEKKTEWKWGQRGSLCTVDSEETLVVREGWKALIRSKAVE